MRFCFPLSARVHYAFNCGGIVDALRTCMQAAEDLLSQVQGRFSATEALLVDAKVQAAAASTTAK